LNVPSRPLFIQALDTAVGILRLRKGPEDMPAAPALLWLMLLGGVLLRAAAHAMPAPESTGNPAVLMALELGITLGGVMFALRAAGYPERFTQTATSILAVQLVMAPALLATRWLLLTYYETSGMGGLAQLLYVIVAVWLLVATVRILRSATGWPLFGCVVLALGIEMITVIAALALYPPPPETAASPL